MKYQGSDDVHLLSEKRNLTFVILSLLLMTPLTFQSLHYKIHNKCGGQPTVSLQRMVPIISKQMLHLQVKYLRDFGREGWLFIVASVCACVRSCVCVGLSVF